MRHVRPLTRAAVTVVAVAAVGLGGWMGVDGLRTHTPPAPSAADTLPAPSGSSAPGSDVLPAPSSAVPTGPVPTGSVSPASPPPGSAAASPSRPAGPQISAMPDSPPVRIRIPRIGVDAPVMRLSADAAGHLGVPPEGNRNLAGWYQDGPSPGSAGNAIIDGHVDTTRGPAVFYALGALRKGATILVTRADRTVAEFSVYAVEVYPKAAFPDQKVYGPTRTPELRLLTCGGGYTKATGYLGNVVVYARLFAGRRP